MGGIDLREYLYEIKELDEKIKNKLEYIKHNSDMKSNNINEIKALKNTIYEKASKTFIYNLKKLIQIESTQKKFANKTGISEDLLSKYKSGKAFPSIETLLYICNIYDLSLDRLINIPLSTREIEMLEIKNEIEVKIFKERYFVYFLVTNIEKEGAIHEGIIDICNNNVKFKIFSNAEVIKYFVGNYNISDKLIFFNLHDTNNDVAYINMIKPNLNKNKYIGGLAMLMLPSDANSKPCAQKILFSSNKLDRELHYNKLQELLNFHIEEVTLGNIKISQWEDEIAYNFIRKHK